jgi:hypothetical protein
LAKHGPSGNTHQQYHDDRPHEESPRLVSLNDSRNGRRAKELSAEGRAPFVHEEIGLNKWFSRRNPTIFHGFRAAKSRHLFKIHGVWQPGNC